ncbi:aminotransferase class I/II-fold pyridoxal phosphate-dependent enzyme [Pleionea sediminis]|uniref:aminotransferase class I/II-fold pyridoxal phosphate-dependent enzyme n=1 Tax=Pleionea sediminis TaxID=2569479 RepID=UPI001185F6A2|nr:8-amino-7-oxononanoate synthase [Pleionea sediminis]
MNVEYANWLNERLERKKEASLYRQIKTLDGPQGPKVTRDGRILVNFSSNDYLSMSRRPEVVEQLKLGADKFGVGSGASHLISGHQVAHEKLQDTLKNWLGYSHVSLFSSGYQANLALMQALFDKPDLIVHDKLNHASLIDGMRLTDATNKRFMHCNVNSLKQQLNTSYRFKSVISDGVFSMDGDIAPLDDYQQALKETGAILIVDDAHGLGVIGAYGTGTKGYFNFSEEELPVLMGTFGKALGTSGAFIATNKLIGEVITQFARPYIYTTASSPALALATQKSIEIIRNDDERRSKLISNIQLFKSLAELKSIPLMSSEAAIQPVLLYETESCIACAQFLESNNIWVGAIRPPTVKEGFARLRITLNAEHQEKDIERLVQLLDSWFKSNVSKVS